MPMRSGPTLGWLAGWLDQMFRPEIIKEIKERMMVADSLPLGPCGVLA